MKETALLLMMMAIFMIVGLLIHTPDEKPCDGQLVTGAIGNIDFRYCIHPVVAR